MREWDLDQRIFQRIEVTVPACLGVPHSAGPVGEAGTTAVGIARNMSSGGICISVPEAVEVGRLVELELTLPPPTGRVGCRGRVVWCNADESRGFDMGIEFWWTGQPGEVAETAIHQFVRRALGVVADSSVASEHGPGTPRCDEVPLGGPESVPQSRVAVPRFLADALGRFRNALHRRAAATNLQMGAKGVQDWNAARLEGETVRDLRGIDLDDADLNGIDFRGLDLREVSMQGADLAFAHLDHADLRDAWLVGARLTSAELFQVDFRGCVLMNSNLRFAAVDEADFEDADLSGADLRDADLRRVNLRKARLAHADLRGANMQESNLDGADLMGADLRDCQIAGVSMVGARFYAANLQEVDLTGVDLTGASLSGAHTRGATVPEPPVDEPVHRD